MFKKYRPLQRGEFVLVGCDCSMGCGDYSVAQFISKNNLDVPIVWSSKGSAVEMTNAIQPALEKIYLETGIKPLVAYERNNGGSLEMERLAGMNRLGKYSIFQMPTTGNDINEQSHKLGWDTNSATRPAMLASLKEALDSKILRLYDEQTVNEISSFVNVRTSYAWKAQAETNAHDDHIMALAIAWKIYEMSPSVQIMNKQIDNRVTYTKLYTNKGRWRK